MWIARHIEAGDLWANVCASHEIETLAILVEAWRTRITQAVSHLPGLRFLQRIDKDGAVPRLDRFRVSDPAAIWRPIGTESETTLRGVNFDRRTLIDIDVPQVEPLVREGELFAIG